MTDINHQLIPATHYLPLATLKEMGFDGRTLKKAAQTGGILQRWRSRKSRRVFYRHKNLELF